MLVRSELGKLDLIKDVERGPQTDHDVGPLCSVAGAVLNTLFQLGIAIGLAITTVLQGESALVARRILLPPLTPYTRYSIIPWFRRRVELEGLPVLVPLRHGRRTGRGNTWFRLLQGSHGAGSCCRDRGEDTRAGGFA